MIAKRDNIDENGSVVPLGFILVVGIISLSFIMFQTTAVPLLSENEEATTHRAVEEKIIQMDSKIHRAAFTGVSQSTVLGEAVSYPVFAAPTKPPKSFIQTLSPHKIILESAVEPGNETKFEPNIHTTSLLFQQDYNYLQNARDFGYENGLVYSQSHDSQKAASNMASRKKQTIIRGTSIDIITLQGKLSEHSSPAPNQITFIPVEEKEIQTTITNKTDSNISITIPTRLPESYWNNSFSQEMESRGGHISNLSYSSVNPETGQEDSVNYLTIEMEPNIKYDFSLYTVQTGQSTKTGLFKETEKTFSANITHNNSSTKKFAFDATGVEIEPEDVEKYSWDFGDGEVVVKNTSEIKHSYNSPGDYNVILTLTDKEGNQESDIETVSVSGEPPVADFTFSPTSPTVGTSVTFDASSTTDEDGDVQSYAWAFPDGTTESGETTTKTYGSTGTYDVSLEVTDSGGNTDSITKTASVMGVPNFDNPSFESYSFDGEYNRPDGWDFEDDSTGYSDRGDLIIDTDSGSYNIHENALVRVKWTGNGGNNKAYLSQTMDLSGVNTIKHEIVGPSNGNPQRSAHYLWVDGDRLGNGEHVNRNEVKTLSFDVSSYSGSQEVRFEWRQRQGDNLGNPGKDNIRTE